MPPISSPFANFTSSAPAAPLPVAATLRTQWENPKDVVSILMIVGGDIVQRTVAQLAGTGPLPIAPVAFSFGWVSFSLSTLTAGFGDSRFLPPPECASTFINVESGYSRANTSWVLSRLLQDEEHALERKRSGEPRDGLTIAFYHVAEDKTSGHWPMGSPECDWVYWIGAMVIVVQLAVAAIPWVVGGNWVVFFVTAMGNFVTIGWTALPRLRREKYGAREVRKREVRCLTKGLGSPVVLVFVAERGLRLEDLAWGRAEQCYFTLCAMLVSCVLWVLFLLTVQGLDKDAWYLFFIGSLGLCQNVLTAGAGRTPAAHGLNLVMDRELVKERQVMKALMNAERREKGVGRALLPIFFPCNLRPKEQKWWDDAQNGVFGEFDRHAPTEPPVPKDATPANQPVDPPPQSPLPNDTHQPASPTFGGSGSLTSSSMAISTLSGTPQTPLSLLEGDRTTLQDREGTVVGNGTGSGSQSRTASGDCIEMVELKRQEGASGKPFDSQHSSLEQYEVVVKVAEEIECSAPEEGPQAT